MDQQRQNAVGRPSTSLVAMLCVICFTAGTCQSDPEDGGGAAVSTPVDDGVDAAAIPTAPDGEVDDSSLGPNNTVTVPTIPEGEVDDVEDPGTSEMVVDWWRRFRAGELAELEQQVLAADPTTMSEPIAVFEVLIALTRNESVSAPDIAMLENLASDPDRLDPTLAEGVAEAIELAVDRELVAPEAADG